MGGNISRSGKKKQQPLKAIEGENEINHKKGNPSTVKISTLGRAFGKKTKRPKVVEDFSEKIIFDIEPLFKDCIATPVTTDVGEVNVLLIGPPSVGKSTLINSIINYLKFKDLTEAETLGFVTEIPTSFGIFDDSFKEHVIVSGDFGKDEEKSSVTKKCKIYSVLYKKLKINFIDTPGISENEKENVQNIVEFVKDISIHAVCLVVKAHDTQLNTFLNICIDEILEPLQINCKDVVFCFTHSKNVLHKPSDVLANIKNVLKWKDVSLELDDEHVYLFDNEAFRYLCISKQVEIHYIPQDKENFADCWKSSSSETKRLLKTVLKNNNSETGLSLSTYLEILAKIIVDTERKTFTIYDLSNKDYNELPSDETSINTQNCRVVCENEQCVECITSTENNETTKYFKRYCLTDSYEPTNCSDCGCPMNKHKQIQFNQKKNRTTRISLSLSKAEKPKDIGYLIQIQKEKSKLLEICAQLYFYAKEKTHTNEDIVKNYIDIWIKKLKNSNIPINKYIADDLYLDLKSYEKSIKKLASSHNTIDDKFQNLIQEVYEFDLIGPDFKRYVEAIAL